MEVKELTEESAKVKAEVASNMGTARVEAAIAEHIEILAKLQVEITERKRRKFVRDRNDYESGLLVEERNRERSNKRAEGPSRYGVNHQRNIDEPRKLKEQREPRERYGGNYRPPRYSTKQYRDPVTADSSAYTSTEDEEQASYRDDHHFLGARPKDGSGVSGRKNPRYPIERDACPQRYRSNSSHKK
ncbi:hypothetical protein XELAEV_18040605mg [Xenopus laevis]|uniref:Uncharacterized protein n=1 Tax=Xenopus laevis TaxID=8355 RepID=A0A974CAV8_XENLA|nr:hypothetical protein XELAEV_18040605mg [Xenopus laevis]